jgi:hypothetical protein
MLNHLSLYTNKRRENNQEKHIKHAAGKIERSLQ